MRTLKRVMEKPCPVCGGDHFGERQTVEVGGKPRDLISCPEDGDTYPDVSDVIGGNADE